MTSSLFCVETMIALCCVVSGAVETTASAAIAAVKTLVSRADFEVLQFNLRCPYQTRPEEVPHRRFAAPAADISLPSVENLDLGLGAWVGVEMISHS